MVASIEVGGLRIIETAGREGVDGLQTNSASRSWLIRGTDDPTAARSALLSPLQTLYDVYSYDGLRLESLSRSLLGPESWEFTGQYGDFPAVGEYKLAIDTTGGMARTTYATVQNAYPRAGFTATNFGNAVDVQDGEIRGVDIIVPALRLTVTAQIDFGLLTSPVAYAKTIAAATGSMNNATFLDFAAGELLFAGATGPIIDDRNPTLTFEFIASQNFANLNIGGFPSVTKRGHDYAWVSYRRVLDSSTNRLSVEPVAMYIAKVYGETDFGNFGIGQLAV